MTVQKNYTVTITGNDGLKCIDANTGVLQNSMRFVGTLISGPIVTGDRVTIVVKKGNTNFGYVYKLPNFLLATTFRG